MKQLNVKISENRMPAQDFCKMRIESSYLAKNIKPGQFILARCSQALNPLLRRPFSVHRILKDGIEMLYEIVGDGTQLLSKRRVGEYLDVIGPLGNGFNVKLTTYHLPLTAILVAGGIGVAPLLALAESLAKKKYNIRVIIGARTRHRILCEKDFKKLDTKVSVATEDGSYGYKGLATDILKTILTTYHLPLTAIYACGPNAMLKTVAAIARSRRIPCQVSLEEYMACGVGVCLGCPVKVRTKYDVRPSTGSGLVPSEVEGRSTPFDRLRACPERSRGTMYEYKMVCKDGPVFNAEEILW